MATATIFNKTLTGGDSKAVILEPGSELLRETNFPANWLKLRIGLIGSWTNLVDNSGTPTAETVIGVAANPLTSLNIGMSNGVSYFGQAGNRFMGHCSGRASSAIMSLDGGNWKLGGVSSSILAMGANIGDGTTLAVAAPTNTASSFQVNNPTATSSCLFGFVLQMDLTLVASGRIAPSVYFTAGTPLSNATDATLNGLLNATTLTGHTAVTGGWWDQTGATPNDCRFLSIRVPFSLNRLVLHNIMLQQLQ